MLLSKMAEHCFREPKTFVDKEECFTNAVPKSTQYKNKWAARIFEEWACSWCAFRTFLVRFPYPWCVENWTESVTWIFVCFLPPTN